MVQTHFIDVIYSVGSDGKDLTYTAELALEKADAMDEHQVLGEIYSTIKGVNEMDKNEPQMDLDSYIAYFEKERPEYVEMILSYE